MAVLIASIVAVSGVSYLIFVLAIRGTHLLNPVALKLTSRLMGLLLAAVAVQFALDALAQAGLCAAASANR
jgi:multiple antibiotic resistance protein